MGTRPRLSTRRTSSGDNTPAGPVGPITLGRWGPSSCGSNLVTLSGHRICSRPFQVQQRHREGPWTAEFTSRPTAWKGLPGTGAFTSGRIYLRGSLECCHSPVGNKEVTPGTPWEERVTQGQCPCLRDGVSVGMCVSVCVCERETSGTAPRTFTGTSRGPRSQRRQLKTPLWGHWCAEQVNLLETPVPEKYHIPRVQKDGRAAGLPGR